MKDIEPIWHIFHTMRYLNNKKRTGEKLTADEVNLRKNIIGGWNTVGRSLLESAFAFKNFYGPFLPALPGPTPNDDE